MVPTNQNAYAFASGSTRIPAFIFQPRDPTTSDYSSAWTIYQGWVNTATKAIWYLESVTFSGGETNATWRAVAPIVTSASAPTVSDVNYPIGQTWVNTAANDYYVLIAVTSGSANWVRLSAGTAGLDLITGNTGGPVGPDGSGNINFTGATLYDVDGNPGTNSLVINPRINAYPVTPYVVGPLGEAGYQTVQSAINAASAAGGGYVYILPGTYAEALSLDSNVHLIAAGDTTSPSVTVSGISIDTNIATQTNYIEGIGISSNSLTSVYITGTNACNLTMVNCKIQGVTRDCFECLSPGLIKLQNCEMTAASTFKLFNLTGNVQVRASNCIFQTTDTADVINSASAELYLVSCLCTMAVDITNGSMVFLGCQASTVSTLPLVKIRTNGSLTVANLLVTANTSATDLFDGDGAGTSGDLNYYGLAGLSAVPISFDTDLAIEGLIEYPLATAGTPITAQWGSSAFDSTYFSVTDGFVTLTGGGSAANFVVDSFTPPGTSPVLTDGAGSITVTGAQVAAGTTANVIRTDSLAANTYTIEVQRSAASASSTVGSNGVCHFDSGPFSLDANAFVSLNTVTVPLGGTGATTFGTPYGVICAGTTATNPLQVTPTAGTAGQVLKSNGAAALPTYESNACFMYFRNAASAAVTGGGLTHVLQTAVSWTAGYDIGSNITFPAGILTFTAPVTGVYRLYVHLYLQNIAGTNNDGFVEIVTTTPNRRFISSKSNPSSTRAAGGSNENTMTCEADMLMTAGNTATFQITVNNGPAGINLLGSATVQYTYVTGFLVQRTA